MGASTSTYYSLTRVREASPSIKDWAATDDNFEVISLLLKAMEQHKHNGLTPINAPGYDPVSPILPTLTESTTGGVLGPGVTVGARLSYINSAGLETAGSPETSLQLSGAASRPLTPVLSSKQTATPGLSGGTYIYVMTKKKASGETLPSDVLPVDISYDSTYSVSLSFNPINTYSDGTTALNIYRQTGLNSSFQLVTTITNASQSTFTDTNTITPGNQNVQPPTANTFDAARKVHINWSSITIPPDATKLRVYVTQQTGIWPNNSLLSEIDLTVGSPPNFVDYIGSETLGPGSPNDGSQVVSGAPKLNLGLEAVGAPILTENMDFAGFQAKNMRLDNTTSPPTSNGTIYYDTSLNNIRARINGSWVTWGSAVGSAYTHPAEEAGGHIASSIKHAPSSSVTAKTIFDRIADPSTGNRKQVTIINRVSGSAVSPTTVEATPLLMPEMSVTTAPLFDAQWCEVLFSAALQGSVIGMTVSVGIEYDSSLIAETVRSMTITTTNQQFPVTISYANNLGAAGVNKTYRVLWWVDTGVAKAVDVRRSLFSKVLF